MDSVVTVVVAVAAVALVIAYCRLVAVSRKEMEKEKSPTGRTDGG